MFKYENSQIKLNPLAKQTPLIFQFIVLLGFYLDSQTIMIEPLLIIPTLCWSVNITFVKNRARGTVPGQFSRPGKKEWLSNHLLVPGFEPASNLEKAFLLTHYLVTD